MKTVIIPSDFSAESVQVAEAIVRNASEEVNILFIHLFHVADDIQDLLFSNYRKKEYEFVSEEFRHECEILKEVYPSTLKSIKIEFFYGSKLAVFKNFLDYNNADYIGYSKCYGMPKLSKSSIDALPVIMKCGLPLIDADKINESVSSNMENAREVSL
ncbi:hypothetical protein SAMN04487995_0706 [Dyadobacter koreensis]|uniref:Nucleotide-binding universal stress protein, UspA family n=1 Tax=Dyadobacter koreensis TaxID=408657 RepID=A0A1H6QRD9_9BACT|nr:hypothetical protein [Dyadobacter koreensis]SEI43534.1 hypothetical protein SAMN04487995_0706 [Dyadobacter koreensis]